MAGCVAEHPFESLTIALLAGLALGGSRGSDAVLGVALEVLLAGLDRRE
ncbi:MAG: hypothetical protein KDI19_15840 [Pseudomonadales bacterium]|nr:hypothetical protein [Pseudomonadales bacterium]